MKALDTCGTGGWLVEEKPAMLRPPSALWMGWRLCFFFGSSATSRQSGTLAKKIMNREENKRSCINYSSINQSHQHKAC
jgi:hypothetical protein